MELNLFFQDDLFKSAQIKTVDSNSELNEYDLQIYLMDLFEQIIISDYNGKTESYVIRNYYSYFNSSPFDLDIVINTKNKVRIHTINSPSRGEPLTEEILEIDTKVEAINLKHAQSIAYTITKNACAYLSVLLDVGFEEITSNYRIFLRRGFDSIIVERYRTGFLDDTINVIVKDNMQGLKSLKDKGFENFWDGSITTFFSADKNDFSKSSKLVLQLSKNPELEETFKTLSLHSERATNFTRDDIDASMHFPNQTISVPSCIRRYYKGIEALDETCTRYFLAASRLYNLSLTACKNFPSMKLSYIVSSIETLAKSEGLKYGEFIKKYGNNSIDEKLLDYCYGAIRCGHFHSGEFRFNEYDINLCAEFDDSFQEKINLMNRSNSMLRLCFVNWINEKILK